MKIGRLSNSGAMGWGLVERNSAVALQNLTFCPTPFLGSHTGLGRHCRVPNPQSAEPVSSPLKLEVAYSLSLLHGGNVCLQSLIYTVS